MRIATLLLCVILAGCGGSPSGATSDKDEEMVRQGAAIFLPIHPDSTISVHDLEADDVVGSGGRKLRLLLANIKIKLPKTTKITIIGQPSDENRIPVAATVVDGKLFKLQQLPPGEDRKVFRDKLKLAAQNVE